jgi:hypothetical protein
MSFEDALRAAFPVETELFSLLALDQTTLYETGETVPGIRVDARGDTRAVLQLHRREWIDGRLVVRDIKEQELRFLAAKHRGDPRAPAFTAGWAEAVREVFRRQEDLLKRDPAAFDRFKHSVDRLMPHDFCASDVLALQRPKDAAAFTEALLSSKKRFARYLP